MLSKSITDLLHIEYEGLFDDNLHCYQILSQKKESGDADTPPELMQGHIMDLSEDLFIWITEQHLANNTGHLIAKDVMSNISVGLSGTYEKIVDMLAAAGHEERAAQIRRADVAGSIDAFREFLRAHKAVNRHNSLTEEQKQKRGLPSMPDSLQCSLAADFPEQKQQARDSVHAFEHWLSQYGMVEKHSAQIELWKEELETEKKPKLPPADKTPMSEELFWEIIERAQSASEIETVLKIEDQIATYAAKAIRDAGKLAQSCLVAAYRDDIWALAYLLQDGCSDDAFEEFRGWMVLQGRAVFEGIMQAPDMFDPQRADGANFAAGISLLSAFENAYLSRTGKPLILPRPKYPTLDPDEDKWVDALPTVAAKLAGR